MTRPRISKANLKRIQAGKLPLATEAEIQAVIVDGLRVHGFTVFVTSRRVKRCQKCGAVSHHGDGASKGLGDLVVRRRGWPAGVAVMLEVKRPGPVKWSSPEQHTAAIFEDILIVTTLEEALAALGEAERAFG